MRKKCSEIYFTHFLEIITVDEMGSSSKWDQVDKMGVEEMRSRQSGNKPKISPGLNEKLQLLE